MGSFIRWRVQCNVVNPPDFCLFDGSAYFFSIDIIHLPSQVLDRFYGMGIYHPAPGTGGSSEANTNILRRAVAALRLNDPSRHPYVDAAQSCGNDQFDMDVFDKSRAVSCIIDRAEAGRPRSLLVLVGPENYYAFCVYMPTGMLVKFEVPFRRRENGREREETMTVIVQM